MIFTDPNTETMCKLLGGICFKGITLSRDQVDALMKLYGFHHERKEDWPDKTIEVRENPHEYVPYGTKPKMVKQVLKGAVDMAETAMLVSLRRHAERDGLRMMAMLAKFCEPGQDPVKLLVQLCNDAGYDVGALCEWAYEEGDDEQIGSADSGS